MARQLSPWRVLLDVFDDRDDWYGSLRGQLVLPFLLLTFAFAIATAIFAWTYFTNNARSNAATKANEIAVQAANVGRDLTAAARQSRPLTSAYLATTPVENRDAASVERLASSIALSNPLISIAQVAISPEQVSRVRIAGNTTTAVTPIPMPPVGEERTWRVESTADPSPEKVIRYVAPLDAAVGPTAGYVALDFSGTAVLQRLLASGFPADASASFVDANDARASFGVSDTSSVINSSPVSLIGGSDLRLVVSVPSVSHAIWWINLAKSIAAGLLPALLVWGVLGRRLASAVADIGLLARSAERFKLGATLDTLPLSRHDEIGRVARAVASMSDHASKLWVTRKVDAAPSGSSAPAQAAARSSASPERGVDTTSSELAQLRTAVEAATDGIAFVDRKLRIEFVNPAFANEFRMQASVMKGLRIVDLIHPADREAVVQFDSAFDLGVMTHATIRFKRGDSHDLYAQITASPVRGTGSGITGLALIAKDVTAQASNTESMTKQLLIDPLTEVWRRSALVTELERRTARPEQTMFSVLFIDLDGFKSINDRFGHEAGDQVLRAVGGVLKASIRENDVAARYGGDEFVIVVDDDSRESNARRIAQRIIAAMPTVTGLRFPDTKFSASVGIACFPRDADSAADVIRCADHAMYAAKRAGGSRALSWIESGAKPNWNAAPPMAEVLTLRRRS